MTLKLLICGLLLAGFGARAQCPLQLDSARWEEVLRDDFNSPALDTSMWDTTPRMGNDPMFGWGCEWYDPADTSLTRVAGGTLYLRATRWRHPDGRPRDSAIAASKRVLQYRAGMINLKQRRLLESYGAYEARLKLPANPGTWPAFWLWSCPTEIDIVDGVEYSGVNEGVLQNVIDNRLPPNPNPDNKPGNSCGLAPGPHVAPSVARDHSTRVRRIPVGRRRHTSLSALTEGFNTFTMVWTPEEVRFYINGRPSFAVPRSSVGTVQAFPALMLTMQMYPWARGEDVALAVDYVRILKPRAAADGQRPYASTPAHDPACIDKPPSWLSRLGEMLW